jgi:hypothetical protein
MSRSLVLSRARLLALALAAALLGLAAWQLVDRPAGSNASAAVGGVHITMKVTGHKTGAFKGEDNARTPVRAERHHRHRLPVRARVAARSG